MTEGASDTDTSSSLDQLFSVLAVERRRYVLYFFRNASVEVATLDDVAAHLLAQHEPTTDRERARIVLHHQTLPKLDEAGIIEYDIRSETVRYHGQSRFRQLVCLAEELEDRE